MSDGLRAAVDVSRERFHLAVELVVPPGETVVVMGPYGAGKTTLLHAIAGLIRTDPAAVVIDGVPAGDVRARHVGLMFQEPSLFPHLSVLDNVAFGPRSRGQSVAASRRTAMEWLVRFELDQFASRMPRSLSGGQGQRVALARALAAEPRVMLLDEPLASVDLPARADVRHALAHHLRTFAGPVVLVTHDLLDAFVFGDRVAVLADGRIAEEGRPDLVASRPRSDFAAGLAQLNLLRGVAEGQTVRTADGRRVVGTATVHGPAAAVFAPAAVAVYAERPSGSPRNVWPACVARVEPRGATVRVVTDDVPPLAADVTPGAAAALGLRPNLHVWISVKATQVDIYAT